MRVRCVTLNLKGVGDGWFEKRSEAVIEGLGALSPDIVCLQETTVSRGAKPYDQAETIGEAIGLHTCAFAPYGNEIETMSQQIGGVAILARWPITKILSRRLPPGHGYSTDSRVALIAGLMSPESPVYVATTHLSWKPEEAGIRLIQMGVLLSEITAIQNSKGVRILLAGDFNATEDEPVIRLTKECLQDSYRVSHPHGQGWTWSVANPMTADQHILRDRRIDYVFAFTSANILRSEVVLDRPTPVFASDHFGVMSDIDL